MNVRSARSVRIFCPVSPDALAALVAGRYAEAEVDPALAAILAVIRDDGPLGDFGIYTGVLELTPGWESFRPSASAHPVAGEAGQIARSPTVMLTTWVSSDVPDDQLSRAIDRLLAVHPWEVPVIEIGAVSLALRSGT